MALQPNHILHLANLFRRGQEALFDGAFEFNDAFQFLRETQLQIWKEFGTSGINKVGRTVTEALTEAWLDDLSSWPDSKRAIELNKKSHFEIGPDNLLSLVRVDPITGIKVEIKNTFER